MITRKHHQRRRAAIERCEIKPGDKCTTHLGEEVEVLKFSYDPTLKPIVAKGASGMTEFYHFSQISKA